MTHSYRLIKQKPYCCVPACLSMVLNRRGIKHGSQGEIGYELGLTVPKEEVRRFKKVRTGKKPSSGWGTQVQRKQFSINHYFAIHGIRLRESYRAPNRIKDIAATLTADLKRGNDVIACFDHKTLYGKGKWGHAVVVKAVDGTAATLLDPHSGIRRVNLLKLQQAMKAHGVAKRGGLWVIGRQY